MLKNGGAAADTNRMTAHYSALLATAPIAQVGYSVIVLALIVAGVNRITKRNR